MKTRYIAIEGGEGSGKSSAIEALDKMLGGSVVFVQEPGTTELGKAARKIMFKEPFSKQASPDTLHSLMWGARFDTLKNVVIPALEAGKPIISDRSLASSYAYNAYAQTDGGLEEVFWAMKKRLLRIPDTYIFLDVDPAEGVRRAKGRNGISADGNHLDDLDIDFHTKVREGYMKFFGMFNHVRIDANQPLRAVMDQVLSTVRGELDL